MSDPILDIESSEQDSEPRELLDIAHGTVLHRITFGTRDVNEGLNVYTAVAGARGEIGVIGSGNAQRELTLTLPINHAFVRRYLQQGVPPGKITVTLRRKYVPSGEIELLWRGEITSMSADDDGTEASFRVPARTGEALLRVIPAVTCGRGCPHILYDRNCGIDRNGYNPAGFSYKCSTSVIYVSGRDVRVDLSNVPVNSPHRAEWAVNGEIAHVASGERMTIRDQTDITPGISSVTTLSMQLPIVGMKVGDTVEVYAGCQWDPNTCNEKFDNIDHHGGYPYSPKGNPFIEGSIINEGT
jgi:hypothetical protein